jgi:carboxyl-terminal processing protease
MRRSLPLLIFLAVFAACGAAVTAIALAKTHHVRHTTNGKRWVPVADLKPLPAQVLIARVFYDEVRRFHYPPIRMSTHRGQLILKEYLHLLDPDHYFFTAPQVASLYRTYGKSLSHDLRQGDLRPGFRIYVRYRIQASRMLHYAIAYLHKKKYNFKQHEDFVFAREHSPWEPTTKSLRELWKKRLLSELIGLRADGKTLPQAQTILRRRYTRQLTRLRKIKQHTVFDTFMTAFAKGIDPHTSYFSPLAQQQFRIAMSLKLHGIGTQLVSKDGYATIVRVLPGGPAALSKKLHPGDRITAVGEGRKGPMKDVVGRSLNSIVEMIRGPKGSIVRLRILPAGTPPGGHEILVDLVRATIRLKSGAAHARLLKVSLDHQIYKVGVLTLPTFYLNFRGELEGKKHYRSAYRDMKRLLIRLKHEGMDALVLDLRNNGGGSLHEAARTIGLFIRKGPVVQIMSADGRQIMLDPNHGPIFNGPVVILVNRLSASATEIFTAALKDYHRAIVMGSRTYGKGTVQTLINLHPILPGLHAGEIKLTIAKFYRINGISTQDRGIKPDLPIPSPILDSEFGEEDSPNALPWSRIAPASYSVMHVGLERDFPTIEKKFNIWAHKNRRYALYVRTVELARQDEKITSVPLNLKAYMAQRHKRDLRQLALDNAWLHVLGQAPINNLRQLRQRHLHIPRMPLVAAEHVAALWAAMETRDVSNRRAVPGQPETKGPRS